MPDVKQTAARVAEALTTYEPDQTPQEALEAVLAQADEAVDAGALAAEAAMLHESGAGSRGTVVNAQLGGLAPNEWEPQRASVLVVVDQRIGTGDGARSVRRTLDVRLRRRDGQWAFEALASAGGAVVERPSNLPAAAVAVLDHPGIELADTARWDIHAGAVDERLLELMVELADEFPYAVTCLRSGHPHDVFGTDHVSNHTLGRAVDIWSVDGKPVVLQHEDEDSPARRMTALAFSMEAVAELGSPWDLDGPPPPPTRSFTNVVHTDHLHVAL